MAYLRTLLSKTSTFMGIKNTFCTKLRKNAQISFLSYKKILWCHILYLSTSLHLCVIIRKKNLQKSETKMLKYNKIMRMIIIIMIIIIIITLIVLDFLSIYFMSNNNYWWAPIRSQASISMRKRTKIYCVLLFSSFVKKQHLYFK